MRACVPFIHACVCPIYACMRVSHLYMHACVPTIHTRVLKGGTWVFKSCFVALQKGVDQRTGTRSCVAVAAGQPDHLADLAPSPLCLLAVCTLLSHRYTLLPPPQARKPGVLLASQQAVASSKKQTNYVRTKRLPSHVHAPCSMCALFVHLHTLTCCKPCAATKPPS